MTIEHLLIILLIGLIAGWLAGLVVSGGGFGLIGDMLIGIVGAFIGNWLFAHFHWHIASGLVGAILQATVGAIVLLLLIRLVNGAAGPRYRRW